MPQPPKNTRDFSGLVELVKILRGPDGCPWDKEQTHQSLSPYAQEEVGELVDALDLADDQSIQEELGDVLLQVVLHTEIARQEERFEIQDVVQGITEKMIRRHPHVFGETEAENSNEALRSFYEAKSQEKKKKTDLEVPRHLPALLRSQKIGQRKEKEGFDWDSIDLVWNKVEEELGEVRETLTGGTYQQRESEVGDLLFTIVQLARHLKIDAEQALRKTNQRFERRFKKMMEICREQSVDFAQLSIEEKEKYWEWAKKELKK